MSHVLERIARSLERSARPPGSVRLLAVTKGIAADTVREAFRLGAVELGESRVQEAEPKIVLVGPGPRWHLVGHLQSNKAKRAVALFEEIHSIDSEGLAEEVGRRALKAGKRPRVYVEVNTSGDPGKHGARPEDAPALIERVAAIGGLSIAGLMTIGPLEGGAGGARASFRALRRIRDESVARGILPSDAGLSMGMTGDFEIAIEEGATIVRVGSALFSGEGSRAGPGGPGAPRAG